MFSSTKGVSVSFFVCHGVFALLNLSLSLVAYANSTDIDKKIKGQSVFIYAMWLVVLFIHLGTALCKMSDPWKYNDTITSLIVIAGVVPTILFSQFKRISLFDPAIKASLAIFFKSVPQVSLAYNIYMFGTEGLSGVWILVGHITILTRIVHLWISNHERWDRNTKWSFVSEVWNEVSWLVASAAWLLF